MTLDDLSIRGTMVVYRRVSAQYLTFDANGSPVMSDGAFRTIDLSLSRSDRVTPAEVLSGYPNDGLAEITVQAIRDAGCIVAADEPPVGHLVAQRADRPGQRISASSATRMARAARLVRLPNNP